VQEKKNELIYITNSLGILLEGEKRRGGYQSPLSGTARPRERKAVNLINSLEKEGKSRGVGGNVRRAEKRRKEEDADPPPNGQRKVHLITSI